MRKDKSNIIAIILVIITLFVVVITFIVNNSNKEEPKISIVTNYSDFYTVSSCIYRTFTHVSAKDSENLMLLLSDNYIKNNNVTNTNVLTHFIELGDNPSFLAKKMYYQNINDDVVKYYVMGIAYKNEIYDDDLVYKNDDGVKLYFIVYLDYNNSIFYIEPYDGNIFKVGETNEG